MAVLFNLTYYDCSKKYDFRLDFNQTQWEYKEVKTMFQTLNISDSFY
jgi:hypothetical protein